MPLINFKFSIVTVRETVKCVDISTEQIWLMTLNINTICYRLESLFQFFFLSTIILFIRYQNVLYFPFLLNVIWNHGSSHTTFPIFVCFFLLEFKSNAKNMGKKSEAKKNIIILICNEKKEVILFFSVSSLELWYVSIYFFYRIFFSFEFFFRYINVRFS